jgi:uncharacterized phage protein gp47/JayE
MQSGVTYTLTENYTYDGTPQLGYFYAVVDDSSGAPTSTFIDQAYAAIEPVRGFTITFGVFPPEVVTANVSMVISVDASGDHDTIVGMVQTAIQDYIAGLALGQLLAYSRLSNIAYGASSLVTNVSSVTLNGGTADIAASGKQVIRAGTVAVS